MGVLEFIITIGRICDAYVIYRPEADFVGRQPSWVTGSCPVILVGMVVGKRLLVETIITFDFVLHRSLRTYLHRSYSRHPSFSSSVVTMKLETSRKCSRFMGKAAVSQGTKCLFFSYETVALLRWRSETRKLDTRNGSILRVKLPS